MNYQRRNKSLKTTALPVIKERTTSRKQSTAIDVLLHGPEVKKLEAYFLESLNTQRKLSNRFRLFKPIG